jgi:hypothetical protein
MSSDVKFRIGGALDKSVDVALGEFAKRMDKAAKQMQDVMAGAQRMMTNAAKQSNREQLTDEEKLKREIEKIDKSLTDSKSMELRKQLNDKRRAVREQINEESRAAREAERERSRFAARTSHRATRFIFPRPEGAIGYGKRVAGDLLRGIGVDTSLSGAVGRSVSLESAGVGLAQQERIATGKTRGGKEWTNIARGVGTELSSDPEQIMELMRAMTGKTGDFEGAAASVKELSSMTIAAGANMGEMGSAAGFVYNQLKGMPDAGQRTIDVMRGIVGQTAVGAVEMEEYAKQMGRVAANAKMFHGDAGKNILTLSALAQLSIAEGGATSGADAARAVNAFAQTTSKDKRVNAFKAAGVDLFMPGGTQKKGIMQIIDESLLASKGQIVPFNKMWADTLGQKPTRAMLNVFNEAGGGKAGLAAAHAKIKPYLDAQMSKEVQQKNLEDYQSSEKAKVQRFQNNLDKIASSLADKVLPKLEELAPVALSAIQNMSNKLSWVVDHIGTTAGIVIAASIARAGIESAFRTTIERMLGVGQFRGKGGVEMPSSGGNGFRYGGVGTSAASGATWGGAMGAVGAGAAIGIPIAMGIYSAGTVGWETKSKDLGETSKHLAYGGATGPELAEELLAAREKVRKEKSSFWGGAANMFGIGTDAETKGLEGIIERKQKEYDADPSGKKSAAQAQALKIPSANETATANAQALQAVTLKAEITNLPKGFGTPATVDPKNREQPPGQR